jgi:hypothetical protein
MSRRRGGRCSPEFHHHSCSCNRVAALPLRCSPILDSGGPRLGPGLARVQTSKVFFQKGLHSRSTRHWREASGDNALVYGQPNGHEAHPAAACLVSELSVWTRHALPPTRRPAACDNAFPQPMGYSGGIACGAINSPIPGLRDTSSRPP